MIRARVLHGARPTIPKKKKNKKMKKSNPHKSIKRARTLGRRAYQVRAIARAEKLAVRDDSLAPRIDPREYYAEWYPASADYMHA